MKNRIWGIVAIFISCMSWLWPVLIKTNSSVWECINASAINAAIVMFAVLTSISVASGIFLIRISKDDKLLVLRNKKAKNWGAITIILSILFLKWAWIGTPSLSIVACAEASLVPSVVVHVFTIVAITSIVSGIILIRISK